MHKQDCVLENKKHKILWNLGMPTDHLISARRADLALIDQSLSSSGLCRFSEPQGTSKRIWKMNRYLDLAGELKRQ